MTTAGSKCLDALSERQRDNPSSLVIAAMGVGLVLEGRLREASWRDGMAHMRASQVADILCDLRCLKPPAEHQESLDALRLAILDEEGVDFAKTLIDDLAKEFPDDDNDQASEDVDGD